MSLIFKTLISGNICSLVQVQARVKKHKDFLRIPNLKKDGAKDDDYNTPLVKTTSQELENHNLFAKQVYYNSVGESTIITTPFPEITILILLFGLQIKPNKIYQNKNRQKRRFSIFIFEFACLLPILQQHPPGWLIPQFQRLLPIRARPGDIIQLLFYYSPVIICIPKGWLHINRFGTVGKRGLIVLLFNLDKTAVVKGFGKIRV